MESDQVSAILSDAATEATIIRRLQGYYHDNYIIEFQNRKYILRIPITVADFMDNHFIPEYIILKFLERVNFPAPRVLEYNASAGWSKHTYIPGTTMADRYPDRSDYPPGIEIELARQMRVLHSLPIQPLSEYLPVMSETAGCRGIFRMLVNNVDDLYHQFDIFQPLFRKLGIPPDPCAILRSFDDVLTERELCLCHTDIHRKNIILQESHVIFLDWELAMIGDPLYDIAVHFHRMKCHPHHERIFLQAYFGEGISVDDLQTIRFQIDIYLALERVKSAIVDAVRSVRKMQEMQDAGSKLNISEDYLNKLRQAWKIWKFDRNMTVDKCRVFLENAFI